MTTPAQRAARRLSAAAANAAWWVGMAPACGVALVRDAIGRGHYRHLSERQLQATRTSDTVFVFGSGSSLNEIPLSDWNVMAASNTVSYRDFPRQEFIRADYHMTGDVEDLDACAERIRANPRYADTVFVVDAGWRGLLGNLLVGRRLLHDRAQLFRYRRIGRGRYAPPSRSFDAGLVHGYGSILAAVNFAYLMGWKQIVIAGVDLYDRRTFWAPPGRSSERSAGYIEARHKSAEAIIEMVGRWRALFDVEGVSLYVYDPRSLLSAVLPVYERPFHAAPA